MSKSNAPILVVELCDRRDSGWVQEGTERTPNPVILTAPQIHFISNKGFRKVAVPALDREGKPTFDEDGKPIMTYMNEAIRYIKNQPIISVKEQERLNIKPSHDAINDQIPVKHGRLAVTKEGSLIGLYDFLEQVYYNESNLDRVETASKVFRAIKIDEDATVYTDNEEMITEAKSYILSLREQLGDKKHGQFQFKEDKIDAICELLGVVAESYPTKIKSLFVHANQYPELFLSKVRALEQTTLTDVLHALELDVIKFEGNAAIYTNKDKAIRTLGAGNMSKDKKVNALADYFRIADGHAAYMELKSELEAAKENILKNS